MGLYTRVSTEDQAREGYSIPAQKERLLAFCKAQEWPVADIYADEGISGAKLDRPELNRLRADIRAGKVNLVLAWKVDRLSRKVSHLAQIIDEFDRAGCPFRSATEPFDTSHAAGRAFMQMLSVFAELERETIRERTKMGIAERVKTGRIHGRPRALGYRVEDGNWVPDEAEAAVVRWIYQQYLAGVGTLRTAVALKAGVAELPSDILKAHFSRLSASSIRDRVAWILQNPIYAGYAPLKGELYPGRHKAIVSVDDWQRAQQVFESRRGLAPRAKTSPHLLSGLIFCGECGGSMLAFSQDAFPRGKRRPEHPTKREPGQKRYGYYVCKNGTTHQGKAKTCNNWGISRDTVEAAVLVRLRQLAVAAKEPELPAIPAEATSAEKERQLVQAQLGQIQVRQRRLMDTLEQAPDLEPTLLSRIRDLADEQRRLAIRLAEVERKIKAAGAPLDREALRDLAANLDQTLEHGTRDELREIVRLLVRRVVVHVDKQLEIDVFPV